MSSQRHRVFTRAAALWNGKRYHEAITVLEDAGLADDRMEFVRFAQKAARARYERIVTRWTQP